jgi:hypothetical protein
VEFLNPLLFRRLQKHAGSEGVANLSTDSDYNQLVERVNANRFAVLAVTSLYDWSFSNRPESVINK